MSRVAPAPVLGPARIPRIATPIRTAGVEHRHVDPGGLEHHPVAHDLRDHRDEHDGRHAPARPVVADGEPRLPSRPFADAQPRDRQGDGDEGDQPPGYQGHPSGATSVNSSTARTNSVSRIGASVTASAELGRGARALRRSAAMRMAKPISLLFPT
jgi:hypothetical protein